MKFIVKVPVTIIACVEVSAKNKKEAIEAACGEVQELTPLYYRVDCETDRPNMAEIDGGWFEAVNDVTEIFREPGVTVERSK